jgi:hypothetical protein
MKLLIMLMLLGGCVSKDWRIVQCSKAEPDRCSMVIWPHTETWCKDYIKRRNIELTHSFLKCEQVSP